MLRPLARRPGLLLFLVLIARRDSDDQAVQFDAADVGRRLEHLKEACTRGESADFYERRDVAPTVVAEGEFLSVNTDARQHADVEAREIQIAAEPFTKRRDQLIPCVLLDLGVDEWNCEEYSRKNGRSNDQSFPHRAPGSMIPSTPASLGVHRPDCYCFPSCWGSVVVLLGETFFSLIKTSQMPLKDFVRINRLTSPNEVYSGATLITTESSPETTYAPFVSIQTGKTLLETAAQRIYRHAL